MGKSTGVDKVMEHLKANLEQAAKFSVRAENRIAAQEALNAMNKGSLRTRTQVDDFLKMAIERAKQNRERCLNCHREVFCARGKNDECN